MLRHGRAFPGREPAWNVRCRGRRLQCHCTSNVREQFSLGETSSGQWYGPENFLNAAIACWHPPRAVLPHAWWSRVPHARDSRRRVRGIRQTRATRYFSPSHVRWLCCSRIVRLLENVSTVLADKHRDRLARFERILKDGGYVFQKVLVDASEFGVPQKRKRAFFLVSRDPLDGQEISRRLELLKSPSQSTADALRGLPTPLVRPDRYNDKGDCAAIPNHFAMCHSQRVIEKIAAIEPGTGPMSYRRLHPSRPSNTLFSGHRAHPAHFEEPRSITVREAARLQGFPDDFRIYGSFANQMEQVTNAVPPPLARGVAGAGRPDRSSNLMSKTSKGASLAEKIRATGETREPVHADLRTDQRVLARITDGIYRQPASAFAN